MSVIEQAVVICGPATESLIKYYLYDIPFAKYSVMDTISKLNDDLEFYYSLFDSLMEKTHVELLDELKLFKFNKTSFELENLKMLNFKMSILIKYAQIFMELLASDPVFYSNAATGVFIKAKFSRHLLKLIDLYIDLKESNKIEGGNGFFFYYNFEAKEVER